MSSVIGGVVSGGCPSARRVVAIIGGGMTGAATAFHLAQALRPGLCTILVIEPRGALGHGLAYGTSDPTHRINVPAARMSLISDEPRHFIDWLERTGHLLSDPGSVTPSGDAFPRRSVFGDYVATHLGPALRAGLVRHIQARVTEIQVSKPEFEVRHAIFDRLRAQGPIIWAALDLSERARLVRHLRALWDVHRFRIAPPIATILENREAAGTLRLVAARLVSALREPEGLSVTWRGRRRTEIVTETFDRVIVTTGPAHGAILTLNPAIRSLAQAGLVTADPPRLGLATDDQGQAIGADGKPNPAILIAGPLARGTVGELMGLPEVTVHAEATARRLLARIEAAS